MTKRKDRLNEEAKKYDGTNNPWPLTVEALKVAYELLDMKYLDCGVKHASCEGGRVALKEFIEMFEQTIKDWDARHK